MKSELLFAKRNLLKSKGQSISLFILVMIASLMMSIWLILSLDYTKNFKKSAKNLNSEDCSLIIENYSDDLTSNLDNYFSKNANILDYTIDEVITYNASLDYGNGDMMTYYAALSYNEAFNRSIGKFNMIEESKTTISNPVYLPYLLKTGGGYRLNDSISIKIGSNEFIYNVAGFYEATILGSYNTGIFSMIFKDAEYNTLKEYAKLSTYVAIKDNGKVNYSMVIDELDSNLGLGSVYKEYATLSDSEEARTLSASITTSIISIISIIVVIIAVIVVLFSLSNQIDEGMTDLGVLKAMGMKNKNITFSLFMQYISNALISSLIGIGISYLLLPAISIILETQTGIIWHYSFSILSFIITLLVMISLFSIVVFIVSRKLKRLPPIIALREGIKTHNFKKNLISLDKTNLNLNVALSLKNTFNNLKQNIVMIITSFFLMILLVTTTVMIKNFLINTDTFINMVAGETCDGLVSVNVSDEDEIVSYLSKSDDVKKYYQYDTNQVKVYDDYINVYVTNDCSLLNNQEACYKGKYPELENEVAVGGKFAKENNLKIGDSVTISKGSTSEEYIVCGLIQITNYFGKDCQLTRDGYERLFENDVITYYFDMVDEKNTDSFIEDLKVEYHDIIINTTNVSKVLEGSLGSYISLIKMVVVAIIVISLLIITFVLYLMVKLLLRRKQKDLGILKALGYKSKSLIFQTAFSFIPGIIISVVLGALITPIFFNDIFEMFLSGIGVVRCTFDFSWILIVIFGLGQILLSFGICILLASKIKKIQPTELLTKE